MWKPIDTAPKDGTRFMIYAPAQRECPNLFGVGTWTKWDWQTDAERFFYHHWAENIPCGNCSIEVDDPSPTHWMPLPPEPKD